MILTYAVASVGMAWVVVCFKHKTWGTKNIHALVALQRMEKRYVLW